MTLAVTLDDDECVNSLQFPRELQVALDGSACSVGAGGGDRVENVGRLARLQLALAAGAHHVLPAILRIRRHRVRLAILQGREDNAQRISGTAIKCEK